MLNDRDICILYEAVQELCRGIPSFKWYMLHCNYCFFPSLLDKHIEVWRSIPMRLFYFLWLCPPHEVREPLVSRFLEEPFLFFFFSFSPWVNRTAICSSPSARHSEGTERNANRVLRSRITVTALSRPSSANQQRLWQRVSLMPFLTLWWRTHDTLSSVRGSMIKNPFKALSAILNQIIFQETKKSIFWKLNKPEKYCIMELGVN